MVALIEAGELVRSMGGERVPQSRETIEKEVTGVI